SQIMKVGALTDEMIDANVSVGGIISKLKKSLTKKQEPMVFLNLEDQSGSIEALIFPKTLQRFGNLIELEQIVQITGRLSEKDGEFKLIAEEVRELPNDDLYQMNVQDIENNSVIEIYLPEKVSRQTMDSMKAILTRFPGNTTVNLLITDELGTPQKTINTKLKVSFSEQMLKELRALKEITRVLVKNGR
ncbi:MAG: exodeoxyribonuclease VII large subunit, partial [Patescibacteria group bacterium]